MPKNNLELRLYEFNPAIEKLMEEIAAHTNEDGEWVEDGRPFEEIVQETMNMERDKKDKVLGIGHLILHLDECAERHEAHAAKHAKKRASFEKQAQRLRDYIKGNTSETEKFKDDFVSIYPMKTSAVIPTVVTENLPVEYRRPSLVSSENLDRSMVERLDVACRTKGLPTPFTWEPDKAALKKDVLEAQKNGTNHPYGRIESGRTIVVR